MKIGDKVQINERAFSYHLRVGTITDIKQGDTTEYYVHFDNDNDWDVFYSYEIDKVEE